MDTKNTIWRWNDHYEQPIHKKHQITLEESFTPLERASGDIEKLMHTKVYFKREDLTQTGSFKFRGLSYQLAHAKQEGHTEVIVPTSGNAGIAAATIAKKMNMTVYAFIAPHTDAYKIKELKKRGATVIVSHDSIRASNLMSIQHGIPNLRSSTNKLAGEGYKSLAAEIGQQLPDCDAIFTYSTSGSSIIGMGDMFETLENIPKLNAVQSGKATCVASHFDNKQPDTQQIAGKAGIRSTRRKEEIIKRITNSGGSGWVVTNEEIETARALLKKDGIDTSHESCASLAAAMRATKSHFYENVVIIFSGKNWEASLPTPPEKPRNLEELPKQKEEHIQAAL